MVEPIETSKLGPVRFDPRREPGRVYRAQAILENYLEVDDSTFPKAIQAMLEFEESERRRGNG